MLFHGVIEGLANLELHVQQLFIHLNCSLLLLPLCTFVRHVDFYQILLQLLNPGPQSCLILL